MQVAIAGAYFSYAYNSTNLYGFGSNFQGQLGFPSTTPVVANPTNIPYSGELLQIAGGGFHTLLLTSPGVVYSFGENLYGQCGLGPTSGTIINTATPISGMVGVTFVGVGVYHSIVVNGTSTYAFGYFPPPTSFIDVFFLNDFFFRMNSNFQLGIGSSSTNQFSPVLVPLSDIVSAATGGVDFSLFLTSSGSVYCAGANTVY